MIGSEEEARAFVAERCEPSALVALDDFVARLRRENARQNLVSAGSLDRVWTRHIADSAQLLDLAPREWGPWLDLGTGAGFPGLIVAIMRPDKHVQMIESRKLRVAWLEDCLTAARLANARVVGARVEQAPGGGASVISARAFAPLAQLVRSARRFSTSDTVWLLPKGRSAAQEVADLPGDLHRMFHVEPSKTSADSGIVVGCIEEARHR